MAKLNWQKVKHTYQPQDYSEHNKWNTADVAKRLEAKSALWHVKGKYYNWQMSELPLSYLHWVGMNFDIDSVGYQKVVLELQRRIIAERKASLAAK